MLLKICVQNSGRHSNDVTLDSFKPIVHHIKTLCIIHEFEDIGQIANLHNNYYVGSYLLIFHHMHAPPPPSPHMHNYTCTVIPARACIYTHTHTHTVHSPAS